VSEDGRNRLAWKFESEILESWLFEQAPGFCVLRSERLMTL
jgi:hypothetical protein